MPDESIIITHRANSIMKHLFLDLEDTVITPVVNGWRNSDLINIQSTKDIIESFEPDFLHIFSFALHSPWDVADFNRDTRPFLEDALGMRFSWVPSMDKEIIPEVGQALGWHPSRVDFNDIVMLGKQITFKLFLQHRFHNNTTPLEVVLMDDTVFDETWVWPELQLSGRMIHVK